MISDQFETGDGLEVLASFILKKGESHGLHQHKYAHDAFVVKGTVRFQIGTIEQLLEAPATVRFPPETDHSFTAESDEAIIVAAHNAEALRNR
jgi:quercetin dioxygenase-like cupin family protein